METKKNNPKVISMSEKTRETLNIVAKELKGKLLFTDKLDEVKNALKNLKALPI